MASPQRRLISRISEPCFGFRWGYSTASGREPSLNPPTELTEAEWVLALPLLTETFPDWTFAAGWAT